MSDAGFFDPNQIVSHVNLHEGMRVADFGCGTGDIAIVVAKNIGQDGAITAIDVLTSALESVKARAKSSGLENVFTVRANLEAEKGSTLDDSSQDLVVCANILWQSDKKKEILAEASRILKKDGALVVIEWEKKEKSVGPPMEMRISSDELKQLIELVGLSFDNQFSAGGFHYGLLAKKK